MLISDLHLNKNQFISAIEFTAAETNFEPSLIEKDYFCSVLLHWLSMQDKMNLVFKGGTLLAKVHAGFYRLSEDLDFTLPLYSSTNRKIRSETISPIKLLIEKIPKILQGFHITAKLKGSNESRQYNAEIKYESILGFKQGSILIEIGLREDLVESPEIGRINTLLLNPFTRKPYVNPFNFYCLRKNEAYAEKIRAALTKNRLAIRDFFDLDFAIKKKLINIYDKNLFNITIKKIAYLQNDILELNDSVTEQLKRKINTELNPTLRQQEIGHFNLTEIINTLNVFSEKFK